MAVVEIAVAAVAGYAWQKAKRVAGRADLTVDAVLDDWMQRLNDVVLSRARRNPAIRALQAEAAGSVTQPDNSGQLQVNQATVDAAAQVIDWIANRDEAFAGTSKRHAMRRTESPRRTTAKSCGSPRTGRRTHRTISFASTRPP